MIYKMEITLREEMLRREAIGMEKGIEKGMEKGRQEGLKRGKEEAALKMLEKGLELELIAEVTGLAVPEIVKVKDNLS